MVSPTPQLLTAWRGDGGAAALRAARAGMEIQNHWGSVDSHVELTVCVEAQPRRECDECPP